MISFIYFDVGGVVIDDFSGNDKWEQLKAELGINSHNSSAFEEIWQTYSPELNTTRDVESLLPILKDKLGLKLPQDYSLLNGFVNRFEANPSIWPIIEKARHRVRIGLLTNMYPGMFSAIERKNILPNVTWDAIVDSSIELFEKPDVKFFELAEKRANAKHAEILFIDNSPGHVQAAAAFGWQTFLYDPSDHEASCRELAVFLQKQGVLMVAETTKENAVTSDNALTLQTYAAKLHEYIADTPLQINESEGRWLAHALDLIPKKGKILELGSGAGRNAVYIQQAGYDIVCTDAVPGFIDILQQKGLRAHFLDALKDDFGSGYSMILANGVLVHFTEVETRTVIRKVHTALQSGGIFAFSVKQGNGSIWTEEKLGAPRFFQYWQPEAIRDMVESMGFEWLELFSGHTSKRNASWLYMIIRKH